MKTIFFKQQANRKKEIAFFNFLKKQLGNIEHVNENFLLPASLLNNYINITNVISALETNIALSVMKREKAIEALSILPDKVFVARKIEEVSVDFAIVENNRLYFIEFHERQHRHLSDSRIKSIYCQSNNKYQIPRFAQRLLKDIWRWENLSNYKIVWWDWFDKNQNTLHMEELFSNYKSEYFINGKFSFSTTF